MNHVKINNKAEDEYNIVIKAINIQGLSKTKIKELEDLIDDSSILCISETQKKVNDIKGSSNMAITEQMRELNDKKGGGLMLIHRKSKDLFFDKVETKSRDILITRGNIRGWEVIVILVYFCVNEKEGNNKIRQEMEKYIEANIEKPIIIIIIGDYNGHVGFKGEQKLDENGKMIINWMEKHSLTMLNDVKCKGLYTWGRNNQRSVIDYALASDRFYEKYIKMEIDEDQEKFDLSDHNLIEVYIRAGQGGKRYNRRTWITREYYKTDEESMKVYGERLMESLVREKAQNMKELEERMLVIANKFVKRIYRKKNVGLKEEIEDPAWLTKEIRKGIKQRKKFD